jgi:Leucine-rich repeat (LRR) protein
MCSIFELIKSKLQATTQYFIQFFCHLGVKITGYHLVFFLIDNQISELEADHMRALAASLETLVLAGNSLSSVPEAVLWNLGRLVRLDLSRNNIINIHSMAFQTGLPALAYLHLADNLLGRTHMLGILVKNSKKYISDIFSDSITVTK